MAPLHVATLIVQRELPQVPHLIWTILHGNILVMHWSRDKRISNATSFEREGERFGGVRILKGRKGG